MFRYTEHRGSRHYPHMKIKSDAAVILFLSFVALLYFSFITRSKWILCGPQQFFIYHPIQSFWLSQFFNGNIPWINNAVAGGIPLWADPNLGIFYPGNIIYLVLPLNDAWNATLIFHLIWGQCGVYWLCRKFELPVSASLTGAFAFLLSSPALAALNSNEVLISAGWVPWILGLTYFGLQQNARRTLLASVALSCQWLAGFTFVQAITVGLAVAVSIAVYFRTKQKVALLRFALLFSAALFATAIQWLPSLLWATNSDAGSFQMHRTEGPPYLGWFAILLFLIGLRRKIVWFALLCALIDYVLFQGSPVLAFCFAMGVAFGSGQILAKYPGLLALILPAVVAVELMIVNASVPQSLPLAQFNRLPPIVSQIPDFHRWNIHHSGTRSALSPLSGLHWGLTYGTPPDPKNGLLLWSPLSERTANIEDRLKTGKSLQLLQDARIGYIISDVRFNHPDLGLIKQNATKFFVHRLRVPVSPLVLSSTNQADIRWSETSPNSMVIESNEVHASELTIYRNALPGWECKLREQSLPIHADSNGWMKVRVPAGKNQLNLTYRTPGAVVGTILTLIGTILILAFLLL